MPREIALCCGLSVLTLTSVASSTYGTLFVIMFACGGSASRTQMKVFPVCLLAFLCVACVRVVHRAERYKSWDASRRSIVNPPHSPSPPHLTSSVSLILLTSLFPITKCTLSGYLYLRLSRVARTVKSLPPRSHESPPNTRWWEGDKRRGGEGVVVELLYGV